LNKESAVLLLKLVAFYFFIISTMVAGMPLFLAWVAQGWLSVQLGAARFLGFIPIAVGAVLIFRLGFYFALLGKGTHPRSLTRPENS
jgi:hypothetical protein